MNDTTYPTESFAQHFKTSGGNAGLIKQVAQWGRDNHDKFVGVVFSRAGSVMYDMVAADVHGDHGVEVHAPWNLRLVDEKEVRRVAFAHARRVSTVALDIIIRLSFGFDFCGNPIDDEGNYTAVTKKNSI